MRRPRMTAGCTTTSVAVTELGMTTLVAVVVATVAMIYTMSVVVALRVLDVEDICTSPRVYHI
jgi:type IV secretory pathway VirB3-like protein